jgi:hypothetical protein
LEKEKDDQFVEKTLKTFILRVGNVLKGLIIPEVLFNSPITAQNPAHPYLAYSTVAVLPYRQERREMNSPGYEIAPDESGSVMSRGLSIRIYPVS